jgi:hypothetical protein
MLQSKDNIHTEQKVSGRKNQLVAYIVRNQYIYLRILLLSKPTVC